MLGRRLRRVFRFTACDADERFAKPQYFIEGQHGEDAFVCLVQDVRTFIGRSRRRRWPYLNYQIWLWRRGPASRAESLLCCVQLGRTLRAHVPFAKRGVDPQGLEDWR